MPTWPTSLPCYPINGTFSETPQRNVVKFQPEIGPAKMRRRSTANGSVASASYKMSKAQYEDFISFYQDDLKDGSLPFEMKHPVTDTLYDWQFESEPEITQQTRNMQMVNVSLRRLTL